MRFKTESLTAVQTLLARRKMTDQTQAQFQTFINWSTHPGFGYAHNYTNNSACNNPIVLYNRYVNTGAGTIQLNRWHCVVGTFDGTMQKIYLDGILMESLATPLSVMDVCENVPMTIGKYTNPDPQLFSGAMDDIRIYNRALNQEEVSALCEIPLASCNNWLSLPETNLPLRLFLTGHLHLVMRQILESLFQNILTKRMSIIR